MFAERFENDNWNLLFFDTIRISYKKLKLRELELKSIINKKGPMATRPNPNKNNPSQLNLF